MADMFQFLYVPGKQPFVFHSMTLALAAKSVDTLRRRLRN